MKSFKKILIANRGEIAVRIIRSAKKLNIITVAIFSEADKNALHVELADESHSLGDSLELSDTYLDITKIIGIAKKYRCEAIHPGYGFLSENPLLVAACEKEHIVFIGPNTRSIELMGNKIESREFVKKLNIPMTEAKTGNKKTLMEAAKEIPFPLLVKAAAGGGGKGMRVVYSEEELDKAIDSTSREAKSYFGDGTVFVEKYVEEPRHIEIQVIGDNHGNAVHLFERECSIQRRHQKIIEESPSPTLNEEVRLNMGKAAVRIAKEIGYNNAGTVEFLVDNNLNFYFLEMNTRVQVEHPVTEMVTGVDIVKEQILIAAGNPLSLRQDQLGQHGHAIECRIYAENPAENFMPSPGDISFYQEPEGENVRVDSGLNKPSTIHSFYDPMISKLVVWGEDRTEAIEQSINALNNYHIHGIENNISYLKEVLYNHQYVENEITTKFCDLHTDKIIQDIEKRKEDADIYLAQCGFLMLDLLQKSDRQTWDIIGYWRKYMQIILQVDKLEFIVKINSLNGSEAVFEIEGKSFHLKALNVNENQIEFKSSGQKYSLVASMSESGDYYVDFGDVYYRMRRMDVMVHEDVFGSSDPSMGSTGKITSPMPGKVIKIVAGLNQKVSKGDVLMVVEAMKMENNIIAPRDAEVLSLNVAEGDMVDGSTELLELSED